MKPILTIGMIVKDEERLISQCLKSLQPIREALPCEILIVDTGSMDNTVKIAAEYGAEILFFKWCNDFATAKNYVLDNAKGSWFLCIDADEYFEDASGVIDFFTDGDWQVYDNFVVTERNYFDAKKTKFDYFYNLKGFKINENTRYKGKIHEIIKTEGATKLIAGVLNHDGYIFNSLVENKEKHRRNLAILLEEYEKSSDSYETIRMLFNIMQQYFFAKEYKNVLKYGRVALARLFKEKNHPYGLAVYKLKAASLFKEKQYLKAIKLTDGFYERYDSESAAGMDIAYIRSLSFQKMGDSIEAIASVDKYMNLFQKYIVLRGYSEEFLISSIMYGTDEDLWEMLFCKAEAEIMNGDGDSAKQEIYNLMKSIDKNGADQKDLLIERVDNIIWEQGDALEEIITSLVNKDKEGYKSVEIHRYIDLMRLRKFGFGIEGARKDNRYEILRDIVEGMSYLIGYLFDVYYYGFDSRAAFDLVCEKTEEWGIEGLNDICSKILVRYDDFGRLVLNKWEELMEDIESQNMKQQAIRYFLISVFVKQIIEGQVLEEEEGRKLLRIFGEMRGKYVDLVYREEILEAENIVAIRNEDSLARKTNRFLEETDEVVALRELKKIAEAFPKMGYIIKKEAEELSIRLKTRTERNEQINQEMKDLQIKMEENIQAMLEGGYVKEAKELIEKLESLGIMSSSIGKLKKYF